MAEERADGKHGSEEQQIEGAAIFFTDDGEGREKWGDVEEHDGSEAGKKEIGRARIWIEEQLGPHVYGQIGAVLQDAAKGFIKANGGSNVDRLTGDRGVGAVDEDENLGAHIVEQAVGGIHGGFDAHAPLAGDDQIVQGVIIFNVTQDVKGVGGL